MRRQSFPIISLVLLLFFLYTLHSHFPNIPDSVITVKNSLIILHWNIVLSEKPSNTSTDAAASYCNELAESAQNKFSKAHHHTHLRTVSICSMYLPVTVDWRSILLQTPRPLLVYSLLLNTLMQWFSLFLPWQVLLPSSWTSSFSREKCYPFPHTKVPSLACSLLVLSFQDTSYVSEPFYYKLLKSVLIFTVSNSSVLILP